MKIFYRKYANGKTTYEWGKVSKNAINIRNSSVYLLENNEEVEKYNVLKIVGSYVNSYVYCGNCGALIKDTEKAIHKHDLALIKKADCCNCNNLHIKANEKVDKTKLVDGLATRTTRVSGTPICNYTYNQFEVDKAKAYETCKFYRCKKATKIHGGKMILDLHQDVFDDIPTESKLLQEGWKFDYRSDGCRVYKKYSLSAFVDLNGVLMYIDYRGDRFNYSKKYGYLHYDRGWSGMKTRRLAMPERVEKAFLKVFDVEE